MVADLLFYMFAFWLCIAALGVITAKNPMHCVLFLIFAFFNAAGLFVLLGAEFLGLLLIMVYVGAVAVMFLFVIMTININFAVLKEGFTPYLPVAALVSAVLLIEVIMAASSGLFNGGINIGVPAEEGVDNIVLLGQVLFTNYLLPFQMAGLILLIAMIGAIVLTHRKRENVKKQNIPEQISRPIEDCIEIVKVRTGKGVS
jgi:NADH-quinone oxidoreductase subunit J